MAIRLIRACLTAARAGIQSFIRSLRTEMAREAASDAASQAAHGSSRADDNAGAAMLHPQGGERARGRAMPAPDASLPRIDAALDGPSGPPPHWQERVERMLRAGAVAVEPGQQPPQRKVRLDASPPSKDATIHPGSRRISGEPAEAVSDGPSRPTGMRAVSMDRPFEIPGAERPATQLRVQSRIVERAPSGPNGSKDIGRSQHAETDPSSPARTLTSPREDMSPSDPPSSHEAGSQRRNPSDERDEDATVERHPEPKGRERDRVGRAAEVDREDEISAARRSFLDLAPEFSNVESRTRRPAASTGNDDPGPTDVTPDRMTEAFERGPAVEFPPERRLAHSSGQTEVARARTGRSEIPSDDDRAQPRPAPLAADPWPTLPDRKQTPSGEQHRAIQSPRGSAEPDIARWSPGFPHRDESTPAGPNRAGGWATDPGTNADADGIESDLPADSRWPSLAFPGRGAEQYAVAPARTAYAERLKYLAEAQESMRWNG